MRRERAEFEELLKEQHRFLARSVDAFYSGDIAEAVQIATRIRVLLHETRRSKALLKRLRHDYLQMPIWDKNEVKSDEIVFSIPISMILMSGRLSPTRDSDPRSYEEVRLGRWWERNCLVVPLNTGTTSFSRKELVLYIANKDGGAHVDELPAKYRALIEGQPIRVNVGTETATPDPINLARYLVGQSGAELVDCIERAFQCVPPWPKQPALVVEPPAIFIDELSLSRVGPHRNAQS